MPKIEVSGLSIYPVKSLAGIMLQTSQVDNFGLYQDRRWMVVDSNNHFVTQRQYPRMCLITTALENNKVFLTAPDMDVIEINAEQLIADKSSTTTVVVWHDSCQAIDCGDDAARWLSQFLQIDCRLMYFPDNGVRQVDQDFAQANDHTAFSDGFPILLTSEASLDDLNSRMQNPIEMRRFRPNIVLRGCDAFEEDRWRQIRIGDLTFRIVKPCSRCGIPNIDPQTADRGQEPSRTLISYRRRDGKIYFGQNIIPDNQGRLRLGMEVEIVKSA